MKTKKRKDKQSFFEFPDRLNILSNFLIIIVYGLIMAILLNLAPSKIDYQVILDYPDGNYHEDINAYLFVRSTPEILEESQEVEIKHSIYAYIKAISADKPTNVRYSYSALENNGKMRYFTESSRKGVNLPSNHHPAATSIKSEGFSKYFIKLIYNQVLDKEKTEKVLKISEDVLGLSKKELKAGAPQSLDNEYFELSLNLNERENEYQGHIILDPKQKDEDYHINLQSWLITKNGEIYPYIGLYNYNYKDKFTSSSYPSKIMKNLDISYLFLKIIYQDGEGTEEFYYKETISDLLDK